METPLAIRVMAAQELAARASKTNHRVALLFVGLGTVGAGLVGWGVLTLAFALTGRQKFSVVTASVAALAPMFLAVKVGTFVARVLIHRWRAEWIADAAREFGVDPRALAESFTTDSW